MTVPTKPIGINSDGDFEEFEVTNISSTQIEVDMGALPIVSKTFTVIDLNCTPSSVIVGNVSGDTPTGKMDDEVEMDSYALLFKAGSGQFDVTLRGLEGYLHDKFKINYVIG